MFVGLTFFGIPIEWFLRLAEAIVLTGVLLIIFGIGAVALQRKKEKDNIHGR